jgi:hypothetical protein
MVALNEFEKLDSEFLQLIASDAYSRSTSNSIEVSFQERIGKSAHGQPRDLMVLEQDGIVARDSNRRVQLMGLLPQAEQLLPCRCSIRWLGQAARADRQRLVGAEDQRAGPAGGNHQGFFPGKDLRHFCSARTGVLLDPPLVDIGRIDLVGNSCSGQNGMPAFAARGEHKRAAAFPERHCYAAGCRRRSASKLITAAAVSSIERRVTSILGQL